MSKTKNHSPKHDPKDPFSIEPNLKDAVFPRLDSSRDVLAKEESRLTNLSALDRVKNAERGTFVETTVANLNTSVEKMDAKQGELMPYTRVVDLSEDLPLLDLEEHFQGVDLLIWRYDKYHSSENDNNFITMEVSLLDNPDKHFLVNCGGQSAVLKIENAFAKVAAKEALPPLVASFRKVLTSSGRSFWVVS